MPEYFTSLAAGIARGPFDSEDLRCDVPVSAVLRILFVCPGCYGNEEHMAAEAKVRRRRGRCGKVYSHSSENHLRLEMWTKETITGVILCCLAN